MSAKRAKEMKTKFFPVLLSNEDLKRFPDVPRFIPWSELQPFEDQAVYNHSQDLEQLASRGGLCPVEIYYVMHRQRWRGVNTVDEKTAVEFLKSLESSINSK